MDVNEKAINDYILNNADKVGKMAVDKIRLLLEASTHEGRVNNKKLLDGIYYKIVNNEVLIYSESPVAKFLDKGTKPHIIRAKPGYKRDKRGVLRPNTLSFRAGEVVYRKDGSKINYGDWVHTPEVKHPGTDGKEFVAKALHLLKNDIMKELVK